MNKLQALTHLTAAVMRVFNSTSTTCVIDAEEIYNEIEKRCLTEEQKQSIIEPLVHDPTYEVVEDEMPVAYHQPGAPVIDCKTALTQEPELPIMSRPDMSTIQRTFESFLHVRGVVNRAVNHSIITRAYARKLNAFFEPQGIICEDWRILQKLTPEDLYNEPNLDQQESKYFIEWLGLEELPF